MGDEPVALLYLDDEQINLLAFKAQFRREFEVHTAADADTAMECLRSYRIDFVFSDQRMPDISGTEFLARVRSEYPHPARAIISGFVEDKAIKEGLERETVHATFEKPYRADEVMEFIRTRLNGNAHGEPN
jgi:response regulator RpfG family c-di-GMP phosphodiesterase